jgi:[acyl-carrier-protein] S-malonyltransferase
VLFGTHILNFYRQAIEMLVIAGPGQGSQSPGFLSPWLELPGFAERVTAWSEVAGCDLVRYGTTGSADEITDTAVAQPLLVAAALAVAEELFAGLANAPRLAQIAAGHSVGELAAGAIAGVIDPAEAMRLVGVRGRAMADAAGKTATGMTAVLGGDEAGVLAAIEAAGLTPANINGAGQIVAAGTKEQLEAFAAKPPEKARLRPLAVAGAFHTQHMAPAVAALREATGQSSLRNPAMVLLSNADGAAVMSGSNWLERIVTQVSAPVRWDLCMQTMSAMGASAIIELPPAGTLTGLARRRLPGLAVMALKTPDMLDAARSVLAEHGGPQPQEDAHAPDWRLLVSPLAGTFRAGAESEQAAPGACVGAGAPLGHVEVRKGQHEIAPTFPATILEWLVEDGDPVDAGQPLVRLQPEGTAS